MKRALIIAVIALLIGVGAYCAIRYYRGEIQPEQQLDAAYEAQETLIARIRPTREPDPQETVPGNPLTSCEEVNADTVGWIYIPDTNIDLPIMQGEDNDFYLHNGVDGQYNQELGCPFLDYRCDRDFSGFTSIVYAHHMTKRRMFADISLFADKDFLQSHPEGVLTLPDGAHTVRFFAYLNVNSTAPAYHAVFVTAQEKRDYLDYLFTEAGNTRELDAAAPDENARLLLLSTCTFEFEEARGILVGVIDG